MKHVRLFLEAVAEVVEAAEWYRTRQPGLDTELMNEIEQVLPLSGSHPKSFPR